MNNVRGRPFDPKKPWDTAAEASRRIIGWIVIVATLQFILNGIGSVVNGFWMMAIWFGGAALAAFGTGRIQTYFERRRRLRVDA